jgi:hypothetical protein
MNFKYFWHTLVQKEEIFYSMSVIWWEFFQIGSNELSEDINFDEQNLILSMKKSLMNYNCWL